MMPSQSSTNANANVNAYANAGAGPTCYKCGNCGHFSYQCAMRRWSPKGGKGGYKGGKSGGKGGYKGGKGGRGSPYGKGVSKGGKGAVHHDPIIVPATAVSSKASPQLIINWNV